MIRQFFEARHAKKAEQLEAEQASRAAQARGVELASRAILEIDLAVRELVEPWKHDLLTVFESRVATQVIFGDDPAGDARAELACFYEIADEQFEKVTVDLRNYLRSARELSEQLGMSAEYEKVFKSRLDGVRLSLTSDAMNIAADVTIARNEEMGIGEQVTGQPLENGRRILAQTREKRISF